MHNSIRTIDMYLYRILCDSVVANKECAHCSKLNRRNVQKLFGSNDDPLILDLSKQGQSALSTGLVALRGESLGQRMIPKLFVSNVPVVKKIPAI